jgi:hypothetical protein
MKEIWALSKLPSVLMKQKALSSFLTPYGGSVSPFCRHWLSREDWFVYLKIKLAPTIKPIRPIWLLSRSMKGSHQQRNWQNYWR